MKKIYTITAVLLITTCIWGQTPEKMSYQAVVRDVSSNLVNSRTVGIQISILQGSVTGTPVYSEIQKSNTNANGLVSLETVSGIVVSGTFSSLDWSKGPFFIQIETDPDGGTNYTIKGVSQLMSVPYALHAKTAENVTNDLVDDADADPTNEKITDIKLKGSVLEITEGGQIHSVDLSSLVSQAYSAGFDAGKIQGYNDGDTFDYSMGFGDGYDIGYNDGFKDGFPL
jgi:hypothetical protein